MDDERWHGAFRRLTENLKEISPRVIPFTAHHCELTTVAVVTGQVRVLPASISALDRLPSIVVRRSSLLPRWCD